MKKAGWGKKAEKREGLRRLKLLGGKVTLSERIACDFLWKGIFWKAK